MVLFTNLVAVPAMAATTNQKLFSPCDINKQTANSPICKDKNTTADPVNDKIKTAANIVAIVTGVAAVILIILGGLTMVTSAGNAEAVASARKRIVNAVIGLVVVALAWTIIAFVTDRLIQ
jgi:type IV secretion system pilin